jgi:hypothetical protein
VFKVGTAPHLNNVALGRHGRHRSNVWDYVNQSALIASGKSKLALHPTAKPVGLVADAIRDCSHRNGLILDPFGGATWLMVKTDYYLVEVFRKRLQYPDLRRAVVRLAATHGAQTILIENAGPGMALLQDLQRNPPAYQ